MQSLDNDSNKKKNYFYEKYTSLEFEPTTIAIEQQKLHLIIEDLEYKCELDWNKGIK